MYMMNPFNLIHVSTVLVLINNDEATYKNISKKEEEEDYSVASI